MKLLTKILGIGGLAALVLVVLVTALNRPEPDQGGLSIGAAVQTSGSDSFESSLGGLNSLKSYTFFATSTTQTFFATSTSATSTEIIAWTNSNGRRIDGKFVVAGAKRVTMTFARGDTSGNGNSGSTKFQVEVSPDGTNWYDYYRLTAATSSEDGFTEGNLLWQPYVEIAAGTTTVQADLDLRSGSIYAIRCIVIETTDGEHSCRATADWSER